VPNGTWLGGGVRGTARFAYLARLKREGVLAGAPDLVFFDLDLRGRPVALELKAPRGRLSTAQRALHGRMRAAGWTVLVAYGLDDALRQLSECGLWR